MRIAIVDNDPRARRVVEKYCGLTTGVEVVGEAGTLLEGRRMVAEQRPDALFLEVRLGAENGFELLGDAVFVTQPLTVITTVHEQFAVEAFDHQVVDYLLKPFEFERFNHALDRLRQLLAGQYSGGIAAGAAADLLSPRRLAATPSIHVIAEPDGRTVVVPVCDIEFVRADRNHLEIQCVQGRLRTRCPIKTAAEALLPLGFLRVHRSMLINSLAIRELRSRGIGKLAVALASGIVVPVSSGCREAVVRFGRSRSLAAMAPRPDRGQNATGAPD